MLATWSFIDYGATYLRILAERDSAASGSCGRLWFKSLMIPSFAYNGSL